MSRALTAAERAAAEDHEWELDRVAWNLPQQQEPVGDASEDSVSEPPDEATPKARESRGRTDELG